MYLNKSIRSGNNCVEINRYLHTKFFLVCYISEQHQSPISLKIENYKTKRLPNRSVIYINAITELRKRALEMSLYLLSQYTNV